MVRWQGELFNLPFTLVSPLKAWLPTVSVLPLKWWCCCCVFCCSVLTHSGVRDKPVICLFCQWAPLSLWWRVLQAQSSSKCCIMFTLNQFNGVHVQRESTVLSAFCSSWWKNEDVLSGTIWDYLVTVFSSVCKINRWFVIILGFLSHVVYEEKYR